MVKNEPNVDEDDGNASADTDAKAGKSPSPNKGNARDSPDNEAVAFMANGEMNYIKAEAF